MRLRVSELTPPRIAAALGRRVRAAPHALAWRLAPEAERARAQLERYRNLHRGERAYVLGNGPSLLRTDMSRLSSAATFGVNRIYLHFDAMGFATRYHVCINALLLEQFATDLAALEMPRFFAWSERARFAADPTLHFVHTALSLNDAFEADATRPLCSGGSVLFVALQLAFFMGFAEVIVLGLDHHFSSRGTPNTVRLQTTAGDGNHFHPEYFPRGTRWQLPDLHRSELAFRLARAHYERAGRRIVDATPGGQCAAFERADWSALR